MDEARFDAATRAWVRSGVSRHRVLRSMAGAVIAAGLATTRAQAAPTPGDPKCCAQLQRRAVELCRQERPPDGKGECRVHAYACVRVLDTCTMTDLRCISNSGMCR